ncbi:MAG TPA: serine hydrolase [Dehalococcoidia bacterium]|jgi:beta-lactamase class A
MRALRTALFALAVAALLAALAPSSPMRAEDAMPATASEMADLQTDLQAIIDESGYDITVAVTDLQTGETAGVRVDEPRLTGCTINLLVLIQVIRDVQDGLIAFDDVDWMVSDTIRYSDASLARELVYMLGSGDLESGLARVRSLAASLGLTSAVYDHPPAFGDESFALVDNTMTPADMNRLLAMLWRGELLSPDLTQYILDRMSDVYPGLQYLLAAGAGPEAVVSHKNGFFWSDDGYFDNDAGIVAVYSDGGFYAYAISYYASYVPEEFADVDAGQRIAARVWAYFRSKYGAADLGALASASP